MVEVGMLEIALVGAGLVVGYVLGKMNGIGPREYSDSRTINSHNESTDNRNSNQAGGNIATDKSKQNNRFYFR